jgi:hypothetical protein
LPYVNLKININLKLMSNLRKLFGTISEASLSRLLSKVKTNDFAIISTFQFGNSVEQNSQLNAQLLQTINAKKMRGYILIGHWQEAPDGDTTPDQLNDSVEESVVFIRPTELSVDQFTAFIIDMCKNFNQDSIIVGLVGQGVFLYYKNRESQKVANDISLSNTEKAYSQMQNKTNIPFVFDGLLYPTNNIGKQAFTLKNINYI